MKIRMALDLVESVFDCCVKAVKASSAGWRNDRAGLSAGAVSANSTRIAMRCRSRVRLCVVTHRQSFISKRLAWE